MATLNANPTIFQVSDEARGRDQTAGEADINERDPIDNLEVFDLIREIKDPEHPHTLEQLRVAQRDLIAVDDERAHVHVRFTPTIPHCSMATLIGLCIRVKLLRTLPPRFKVDVSITPGTHASEAAVNKQLNDKERVAAALENDNLLSVVNKCLQGVTEDE
uniref:MIP18 family-like domain-containing protein n=1 Tax=Haptolina ericina TaxID=156174 RepID=A0A7S3BTE5_9EUKA|mmetsp:Transcript_66078/g.147525  ORF Transcript_66078/g.147525 Transcript_66078/m.147525 type:complete len:161 (+) Transcript_66078:98-580(+)